MKPARIVAVIAAAILATVLVAPTRADAQDREDRIRRRTAPPIAQAREKHYDFTADTVNGELIGPDGVLVDGRRETQHTNLIRLRVTFVDSVLRSANDL